MEVLINEFQKMFDEIGCWLGASVAEKSAESMSRFPSIEIGRLVAKKSGEANVCYSISFFPSLEVESRPEKSA